MQTALLEYVDHLSQWHIATYIIIICLAGAACPWPCHHYKPSYYVYFAIIYASNLLFALAYLAFKSL